MSRRLYRLICLMACVALPLSEAAAGDLLTVASDRHRETIVLSVGKSSPHKVFTLDSPDRLVVDVPMLPGHPAVELPSNYKGRLIGKVRYGRFDTKTSRFVFETTKPVTVLDVHTESKKGGQLVIAIGAEGDTAAPAASASREEPQETWPKEVRGGINKTDYNVAAKKESAKARKEPEPAKESRKGKELKEKKDHKERKAAARRSRPVIVIDPGHGGVDPGAEGDGGLFEKDVVLAAAKELQARLQKSGKYKVMLTRSDDTFIKLRDRFEIARKAGASLFVSLHADSAEEMDARGLSVYTLSEQASDIESQALAARENKSDVIAGMDLTDESEDVAGILISLAERETKNRSATFADILVTSLDGKVRLLSNSHRFAGFAVLKAPDVPSVLIEIGFLSHPKEEKLINSKSYREKLAAGIAEGIDRYFEVEKNLEGQ